MSQSLKLNIAAHLAGITEVRNRGILSTISLIKAYNIGGHKIMILTFHTENDNFKPSHFWSVFLLSNLLLTVLFEMLAKRLYR